MEVRRGSGLCNKGDSEMLKLSNTMRNTALAGALSVGLVGPATVTLLPVAAQAQQWHRDMDDRGFRDRDDRGFRDRDDRGFHRDWDDRFRFGVGVGVYGYPYSYPYYSGYYDPYYYNYGPYCSSYDYYYGYCSY